MEKIKRHRSTAVCVQENKLLGFWGKDPHTKTLIFILPGGEIEPGETPAFCAKRECLEETGYSIIVSED